MTERLSDLTARIASVQQLGSVVGAIRGIAAVRAQQGTAQLAPASAYVETISEAVATAANLLPVLDVVPPPQRARRRGLLVFGGEQGFAGAFSERMVDAAAGEAETAGLFLVGSRATNIAEARGWRAEWSTPMAARLEAIPALANRIVEAIYHRISDATINALDLLVPRQKSSHPARIERLQVYPLAARPARDMARRPPALLTLAPTVLLEQLVEEYVYARVCAAALQAFVAENLARLETMAAARTHVDRMLEELGREKNRIRQGEITSEIIELAGADATID